LEYIRQGRTCMWHDVLQECAICNGQYYEYNITSDIRQMYYEMHEIISYLNTVDSTHEIISLPCASDSNQVESIVLQVDGRNHLVLRTIDSHTKLLVSAKYFPYESIDPTRCMTQHTSSLLKIVSSTE
jgi:hypothetical protein